MRHLFHRQQSDDPRFIFRASALSSKAVDFILVSVHQSVLRVLKLARLETIFDIADDLAEAKKSIT